ncbi:glycosyltransferase [Providencia rettgeri]|nr:glycosyltransferase [Providencia rettgeri]
MLSSPLISIIIPVYNVEKYISKSIQSILFQTFTDFECLIINDGTLDKSIEIAKQLVSNDPRFIFFEQENQGQASARNLVFNNCKGQYITFIDSDDYIESNYLLELLTKIQLDDADICTCNVKLVDNRGKKIKEFINKPKLYNKKNDILNSHLYISNWMWDKIYKKECFDNIRFNNSVKTFEDVLITFQILHKRKITSVNIPLYNYVYREGSTSHSLSPTLIMDRLTITNAHKTFLENQNLLSQRQDYYSFVYLKNFIAYTIVLLAKYSDKYKNDIYKFNRLINKKIFTFRNVFKAIFREPRIGVSLLVFKISPELFKLGVNFLKK